MESTTGAVNQTSDLFTPEFKVGGWCAAKLGGSSSARKWSRCIIVDISNRKAFVECVDDDLRQEVHLSKLEKLHEKFKTMNRFAFKAKLSDKLLSEKMKSAGGVEDLRKRILERQWSNKNELSVEIVNVTEDDSRIIDRIFEVKLKAIDFKCILNQ
jgi:hypothetical protein